MTAEGFATLASFLPDRTLVTYDPRGLGRSARTDGDTTNSPQQQAEDLHALIGVLGPVDLFGSSGGAVTALQLVSTHPDDVRTLVAHEPPILARAARRRRRGRRRAGRRRTRTSSAAGAPAWRRSSG